jgi:hypothetical protein
MSHETEAVKYWRSHEGNKRLFAEHAALSGKPASHIAQMIRDQGGDCSNSQAEKYINAYRLYYRMFSEIEAEAITQAWNELPPTYWVRLAELQSRHEIELYECWEFLKAEMENRTGSRAFAAHIVTVYSKTPVWVRKLTRLAESMRGFFLKDYASEIPPGTRLEIEAVFDETAEKLIDIMQRAERLGDE